MYDQIVVNQVEKREVYYLLQSYSAFSTFIFDDLSEKKFILSSGRKTKTFGGQ